jgi:predicted metalloprotease
MRTRIAAVVCGALVAVLAALLPGTPAQAAPAAQAPAAQAPPECTSLEGCYAYADMQAFYDQIITWVEEFSNATYTSMPRPDYVYIPSGNAVSTGCGVVLDASAYSYCSVEDAVYIGQDQLWSFYTMQGDAAAAMGIAHEWGHHVQAVAGIGLAGRSGQVALENQADCIAGAWVGYVDQQGRLERDDVGDINAILQVISAAETADRDHGTLAERTAAVQLGRKSGIVGCNRYFPGRPVLA